MDKLSEQYSQVRLSDKKKSKVVNKVLDESEKIFVIDSSGDKYLMDDYGSPVMEEYTVTEWIEGKNEDGSNNDIQYYTDKIPSDVTVPSDAIVTSTEKDGRKLMRKKLNPDFVENVDEDGFQIYSSREERDEWHIVGLLGQIPVTKGQPTSSNWIKMKDISDTVEMYIVK